MFIVFLGGDINNISVNLKFGQGQIQAITMFACELDMLLNAEAMLTTYV